MIELSELLPHLSSLLRSAADTFALELIAKRNEIKYFIGLQKG
jgi:hypothetical protein